MLTSRNILGGLPVPHETPAVDRKTTVSGERTNDEKFLGKERFTFIQSPSIKTETKVLHSMSYNFLRNSSSVFRWRCWYMIATSLSRSRLNWVSDNAFVSVERAVRRS